MNTNAVRNWRTFARHKKRWEGLLGMLILKERVPKGASHVKASADMRFRVSRKRDEGNFRMVIEKALGDVLQTMGIIPDDTPEHYEFGHVEFLDKGGMNQTRIILEVTR